MRRVVWVRGWLLTLAVFGIFSLQGCGGGGGDAPSDEPPSQPATGTPDPAPPTPAPSPPPTQPPPTQPPPTTAPAIAPLADATCDGRKALGLSNAKLEATAPIAQRRAVLAIQCDTYDIMARISSLGGSATQVQALHDRTRELAARAIDAVKSQPVNSSRLPLSQSHRQMYEVAAEAERAAGRASVEVWATDPWRALQPLDLDSAATSATLVTAVMRGERRALALNVRSLTSAISSVQLSIDPHGLPAGALRIYRANFTGDEFSNWSAAELQRIGSASQAVAVTLLPGVTQQIWIEVAPDRTAQPGRYVGSVEVAATGMAATRIPLDVTVFRTEFPRQTALHFAGWDYTDGGVDARYMVNAGNRAELIAHLQSRLVDVAWGHRRLLNWNNIDSEGNLVGSLDSSSLQQWLSEWRNARRFRVLLHAKDGISGIQPGDPLFEKAVGAWAQAWAAEIRRLGRSPGEFDISVLDEPHTQDVAQTIVAWANAIRRSGAGFNLWTDPIWSDANMTPPELVAAVDRLAVNASNAESGGTAYWNWARGVRAQGKALELYVCEGPARRLDPHRYYRMAAWRAFALGASAVSFWNFSATGGAPSDNEFAATARNYSPLFVNAAQVRAGKQMEAATQGIQDAQYLQMLSDVAARHASEAVRQRARDLLQAAEQYVWAAPDSSLTPWRVPGSAGEAESRRIEIGQFLDESAQ